MTSLKNNSLVSYLILIVSLFILLVVTKQQAFDLMAKLDDKETNTYELESIRTKLDNLNTIKKSLNSDENIVDRYIVDFSEDKIIDYLYGYVNGLPEGQDLLIKSISMTPAVKNELGFRENSIVLNARVGSDKVLKNFLTFLIREDAQYRFVIDSFSFPNDKREGGYSVSIPLKLLYR